jgi:hypothetical protein
MISTSMVGLPRESRISRAPTASIFAKGYSYLEVLDLSGSAQNGPKTSLYSAQV